MKVLELVWNLVSIGVNRLRRSENTGFHPLNSTANSGDHFEITGWVPVTISKPTLPDLRIIDPPYNESHHQPKITEAIPDVSDYSTTICIILIPPRSERHSWKENECLILSRGARTKKNRRSWLIHGHGWYSHVSSFIDSIVHVLVYCSPRTRSAHVPEDVVLRGRAEAVLLPDGERRRRVRQMASRGFVAQGEAGVRSRARRRRWT